MRRAERSVLTTSSIAKVFDSIQSGTNLLVSWQDLFESDWLLLEVAP